MIEEHQFYALLVMVAILTMWLYSATFRIRKLEKKIKEVKP
jgi:hypothetical protein